MSTNILGNPEALRKFWSGPLTDLMVKLTSEEGAEYQQQFSRFLRKQPCWENADRDVQHIIDCSADPADVYSEDFKITKHVATGKFRWDPSRINLYRPVSKPLNDEDRLPEFKQVLLETSAMPVCNANILDFLLERQNLIPETWKEYRIFFLGTGYRYYKRGNVDYRCLQWQGVNWKWEDSSDINSWYKNDVVACFKP